MLKLLHCADLHLDSPFASAGPRVSAVRRGELRESFRKMMRWAANKGCDLVLMAGDLIDTSYATSETAGLLIHEIASNPGCRYIITPGNHDPAEPNSIWKRLTFPDNAVIFTSETPETVTFDIRGQKVSVTGYGFTTPRLTVSPINGLRADTAADCRILCAHCDITDPLSDSAPVTVADLAASGFDYAALGHIHTSSVKKAGDTTYAYSGCLAGRDFEPGETGWKGALYVEIDDSRRVTATFVRFASHRYMRLRANCEGASQWPPIAERLADVIREQYSSSTSLRLILTGSVSPDFRPNLHILRSLLESRSVSIGCLELQNDTLPILSGKALETDPSIRGEFYRLLLKDLTEGTPEERRTAAEALRAGLDALG